MENAKLKKDELLVETRTFTPVTKENFEKWFEGFIKETVKLDKEKIEQSKRLSGREYYQNLKNQKLGGAEEFEKEGEDIGDYKVRENLEEIEEKQNENICFDKDAFKDNIEDNLDEIEFDNEGD